MNRLEDRLRDAYQAAADTVTTEMEAPSLTGRPPADTRRIRFGLGMPTTRLIAPVAAAAAVAAIALTVSLIATSGPGSHPVHPYSQAHWRLTAVANIAQGYPGNKIPADPHPRFYLGIQPAPHGPTEYAFTVHAYSAVTGQQTGQLALPRPDLWARAVASLGNGTYVVAATKDWPRFGCRSWLYQFRLTAAGRPTDVRPFVVRSVPGWARQLGGTDSGRAAVVLTSRCVHGRAQPMNSHDERATAIALPSGATTSWSPWPRGSNLVPEDIDSTAALSANGRLFAFVAIAGQPQDFGLDTQAAYVMLTGHVRGPVTRRYHLVLDPRGTNGVIATALSPNGMVTFAMTARSYGGRWHEMIGAYATKTGKLLTVLASTSARALDGNGYLEPDPSGAHMLVLGFGAGNTAMLHIASHRLSVLHVRYRYPPLDATW